VGMTRRQANGLVVHGLFGARVSHDVPRILLRPGPPASVPFFFVWQTLRPDGMLNEGPCTSASVRMGLPGKADLAGQRSARPAKMMMHMPAPGWLGGPIEIGNLAGGEQCGVLIPVVLRGRTAPWPTGRGEPRLCGHGFPTGK